MLLKETEYDDGFAIDQQAKIIEQVSERLRIRFDLGDQICVGLDEDTSDSGKYLCHSRSSGSSERGSYEDYPGGRLKDIIKPFNRRFWMQLCREQSLKNL